MVQCFGEVNAHRMLDIHGSYMQGRVAANVEAVETLLLVVQIELEDEIQEHFHLTEINAHHEWSVEFEIPGGQHFGLQLFNFSLILDFKLWVHELIEVKQHCKSSQFSASNSVVQG